MKLFSKKLIFKYYRTNYLFNILLLIWCISIPFKNAIYQLSTALIILFFLSYLIIYKDYRYFKNMCLRFKDILFIFILIIFSMTLSNIINDVSENDAWKIQIGFILRYGFVFLILNYFYSKNFINYNSLIKFFFISMLIQAFDGVYQSIYGYDFFKNMVSDYPGGLTGAVFYRNVFGFLMGISLLFSIFYLKKNLQLKVFTIDNLIIFLGFILFTYSTIFSYSRAVWVALFSSFILYLIINLKYLNIRSLISLFSAATLIVIIFSNIDSLSYRFDSLLSGDSSNRYEIWEKGLELIRDKPIFGWGLDSWNVYGLKNYSALHNSILEILLFTGIFGLFSFFLMFLLTFKTIIINKSWELLLILVYLFVDSLFDQSIFKSKIFLSVITVFMFYVYLYRIDSKQKK